MLRKSVLVVIGLGLFFLCFGNALAKEKLLLRCSESQSEGYPTVESIKYMGELLDRWTDGRITVKVFPDGKLGVETEVARMCQEGEIEMVRISLGNFGKVVELGPLNVFTLPYIFISKQHFKDVVQGEIGLELLKTLEDDGYVGLGYMDAGSRSLYYSGNKVIRKPEDMKGMTFRVMGSSVFQDMIEAMGANAVHIPFIEIYDALVSGAIDGAENNPPSIISKKHYEGVKYFSLTEHLMVPEIFLFSKKKWGELSASDQALIKKAANLAIEKEYDLWAIKEEKDLREIEKVGMTIIRNVDKQAFIDRTKSVRAKYGEKYKGLLERIEELTR